VEPYSPYAEELSIADSKIAAIAGRQHGIVTAGVRLGTHLSWRCSPRVDGAVLSHTSAAALWQFLRPIPGPVHVTFGASSS